MLAASSVRSTPSTLTAVQRLVRLDWRDGTVDDGIRLGVHHDPFNGRVVQCPIEVIGGRGERERSMGVGIGGTITLLRGSHHQPRADKPAAADCEE
jgi:hypothetical protein